MDIDWTLTLVIGAALGALLMIASRVRKDPKGHCRNPRIPERD